MKRFIGAVCAVGLLLIGLGTGIAPADAESGATSWVWPLQPRPQVGRVFEPPLGPYGVGHRGVDLQGRVGQSVLATADGVVQFAGLVAGKGVVVVAHGAERSTYQPVSVAVRRHEHVSAGQLLGHLQLGGSHCWPDACLHLGRVAGETYLDPLALLGGGPLRLLPLDGPLALSLAGGDTPLVPPLLTVLSAGAATAPQRLLTGIRNGGDQALGCANLYACRSRSVETWV
ncbi:MAG: M23 family metallopeptidase [Nocardioidaceae bacterium]|nr:M23 family metallopeptidase [Nocardioidaceae bacterium]